MFQAVPTAAPPVIVHPPGQTRLIRAFGDEMHLHLDGSQTGQQLTLWTNVTPPGGGPPPHYHLREDELFVVLEGKARFYDKGQWTDVPVGGVVFAPRGSVHTFQNVGDTPLRMQITATPSGFDQFFARCAEEFSRGGPPDMARLVKISADYGIHYVAAA